MENAAHKNSQAKNTMSQNLGTPYQKTPHPREWAVFIVVYIASFILKAR
jgi:hypothetical protein